MFTCTCCEKPLFTDKESDTISFLEIRDVRVGFDVYGSRKMFCDDNCFDNYWVQYLEEVYDGHNIYRAVRIFEHTARQVYIPYIECPYYFLTLQECRDRVSNNNIGIIF